MTIDRYTPGIVELIERGRITLGDHSKWSEDGFYIPSIVDVQKSYLRLSPQKADAYLYNIRLVGAWNESQRKNKKIFLTMEQLGINLNRDDHDDQLFWLSFKDSYTRDALNARYTIGKAPYIHDGSGLYLPGGTTGLLQVKNVISDHVVQKSRLLDVAARKDSPTAASRSRLSKTTTYGLSDAMKNAYSTKVGVVRNLGNYGSYRQIPCQMAIDVDDEFFTNGGLQRLLDIGIHPSFLILNGVSSKAGSCQLFFNVITQSLVENTKSHFEDEEKSYWRIFQVLTKLIGGDQHCVGHRMKEPAYLGWNVKGPEAQYLVSLHENVVPVYSTWTALENSLKSMDLWDDEAAFKGESRLTGVLPRHKATFANRMNHVAQATTSQLKNRITSDDLITVADGNNESIVDTMNWVSNVNDDETFTMDGLSKPIEEWRSMNGFSSSCSSTGNDDSEHVAVKNRESQNNCNVDTIREPFVRIDQGIGESGVPVGLVGWMQDRINVDLNGVVPEGSRDCTVEKAVQFGYGLGWSHDEIRELVHRFDFQEESSLFDVDASIESNLSWCASHFKPSILTDKRREFREWMDRMESYDDDTALMIALDGESAKSMSKRRHVRPEDRKIGKALWIDSFKKNRAHEASRMGRRSYEAQGFEGFSENGKKGNKISIEVKQTEARIKTELMIDSLCAAKPKAKQLSGRAIAEMISKSPTYRKRLAERINSEMGRPDLAARSRAWGSKDTIDSHLKEWASNEMWRWIRTASIQLDGGLGKPPTGVLVQATALRNIFMEELRCCKFTQKSLIEAEWKITNRLQQVWQLINFGETKARPCIEGILGSIDGSSFIVRNLNGHTELEELLVDCLMTWMVFFDDVRIWKNDDGSLRVERSDVEVGNDSKFAPDVEIKSWSIDCDSLDHLEFLVIDEIGRMCESEFGELLNLILDEHPELTCSVIAEMMWERLISDDLKSSDSSLEVVSDADDHTFMFAHDLSSALLADEFEAPEIDLTATEIIDAVAIPESMLLAAAIINKTSNQSQVEDNDDSLTSLQVGEGVDSVKCMEELAAVSSVTADFERIGLTGESSRLNRNKINQYRGWWKTYKAETSLGINDLITMNGYDSSFENPGTITIGDSGRSCELFMGLSNHFWTVFDDCELDGKLSERPKVTARVVVDLPVISVPSPQFATPLNLTKMHVATHSLNSQCESARRMAVGGPEKLDLTDKELLILFADDHNVMIPINDSEVRSYYDLKTEEVAGGLFRVARDEVRRKRFEDFTAHGEVDWTRGELAFKDLEVLNSGGIPSWRYDD